MQDFNIGIDCEDIGRWREMLPKINTGPQRKFFSKNEHGYCQSRRDPARHYAVRWCAREALLKALSPFFSIDLRSVAVSRNGDGRPYFIIPGHVQNIQDFEIQLSMSHSENTAFAAVIVVRASSSIDNLTLPPNFNFPKVP